MMEYTDIYRKYEKSHEYIKETGLVKKTDRNWDFYIGDQWKGLKSNGEELPLMNIIKPILKYKVSTIAQNSMTANFSDTDDRPEYTEIYRELNKRFIRSWEKAKMDEITWQMVKYAAIQGDSYAYFWSADTNDMPQILSNTMVLFGDENTPYIQDQPYIIIIERLSLEKVKEIAKKNGIPQDQIDTIATDDDTTDQIFNKNEVSDKVTSYLYMEKKDGVVHIAKATKTCVYQELRPIVATQNGKAVGSAKMYPIIPYLWEGKPNSARGVSEVEALIPNQIELNNTLARRAVAVKIGAYPRIAYNTAAIEDPSVLDKVGVAIGVNGAAESINQSIGYLNATNISSDAQQLFNDLLLQTKDLVGAGDMALGNINPERTSGEAITAIRDQTQIPLNEQVNLKQAWVENVALLWFDMWTTYDLDSFEETVLDEDGNTVKDDYGEDMTQKVSPEIIEQLRPSVKIDVSEDNRWTRLSEQQALDNLLQQQQITLSEYADLLPENSVLPIAKLQRIVKEREKREAEQQAMLEQQQQEMAGLEQQMAAEGQELPPPPQN